MLTLFRNWRNAKNNIWTHSTVFTEQEKSSARSKSELNYETSKSCDLNAANFNNDLARNGNMSFKKLSLNMFKTKKIKLGLFYYVE